MKQCFWSFCVLLCSSLFAAGASGDLEDVNHVLSDLSKDLPFHQILDSEQSRSVQDRYQAALRQIETLTGRLGSEDPKAKEAVAVALLKIHRDLEIVAYLLPFHTQPMDERNRLVDSYRKGLRQLLEVAGALKSHLPKRGEIPPGVWADGQTELWWSDNGVKIWSDAKASCEGMGEGWKLATSHQVIHAEARLVDLSLNKAFPLEAGLSLHVGNPHQRHTDFPYSFIVLDSQGELNAHPSDDKWIRSLCTKAPTQLSEAWQDHRTGYWWKDLGVLNWTDAMRACSELPGGAWKLAASYEILPLADFLTDPQSNERFAVTVGSVVHVRDPHQKQESYPFSFVDLKPGAQLNAYPTDTVRRAICIGLGVSP